MKNADEIAIAAGGAIYLGPVPDPEDLAPFQSPEGVLPDEYLNVGWVTDDGVSFADAPNVLGIGAWTASKDVKKKVTGRNTTTGFTLQQLNRGNWSLAFGGGEWEETDTGIFLFHPPKASAGLPEHCFIVDWNDDDRKFRTSTYKGVVGEGVTTTLTDSGAVTLPVSIEVLEFGTDDDGEPLDPWNFSTNDPAFDVAS